MMELVCNHLQIVEPMPNNKFMYFIFSPFACALTDLNRIKLCDKRTSKKWEIRLCNIHKMIHNSLLSYHFKTKPISSPLLLIFTPQTRDLTYSDL